MSYKDDLKAINAVLRNPQSKCFDPSLRPLEGGHSMQRRLRNKALRRNLERVYTWRMYNVKRYRAYMRSLMRRIRATKAISC